MSKGSIRIMHIYHYMRRVYSYIIEVDFSHCCKNRYPSRTWCLANVVGLPNGNPHHQGSRTCGCMGFVPIFPPFVWVVSHYFVGVLSLLVGVAVRAALVELYLVGPDSCLYYKKIKKKKNSLYLIAHIVYINFCINIIL